MFNFAFGKYLHARESCTHSVETPCTRHAQVHAADYLPCPISPVFPWTSPFCARTAQGATSNGCVPRADGASVSDCAPCLWSWRTLASESEECPSVRVCVVFVSPDEIRATRCCKSVTAGVPGPSWGSFCAQGPPLCTLPPKFQQDARWRAARQLLFPPGPHCLLSSVTRARLQLFGEGRVARCHHSFMAPCSVNTLKHQGWGGHAEPLQEPGKPRSWGGHSSGKNPQPLSTREAPQTTQPQQLRRPWCQF